MALSIEGALIQVEILARRGIKLKTPTVTGLLELLYAIRDLTIDCDVEEQLFAKKDACLEDLKRSVADNDSDRILKLAKRYVELNDDLSQLLEEQAKEDAAAMAENLHAGQV